MVSPLAQQTIKRVSEKLESGEAAGLSEIVELIQRLSANAYETSVQELGTLIGKDVVVTAKVIAAANTIGYNPTGVEVSTITQAIHVIGFNKIRQLAVSLLLIENANRTLNANEKREIAAIALCSGLMAESVMSQRGTSAPEHAFICASLRNYGRLLMTTFLIEDYRRARIIATEGVTEDEAFTRVFGLTPLELGHHLLASAHLPAPILKSLRALPADAIRSAAQEPELELLALADLSVRLCELALRPDVSAAEFNLKASTLASRSGQIFGLDAFGLVSVLRETGQQLNEFAHTFGLHALTDQFGPRIQARITGDDPLPTVSTEPPIESAESNAAPAKATPATTERAPTQPAPVASPPPVKPKAVPPPAAPTPPARVEPIPLEKLISPAAIAPAQPSDFAKEKNAPGEAVFQRAFQTGIEQLAGLLEEDPVDMRKIYAVILRSALQGFETEDGCLFVRDPHARRFTPQYGNGKLFQTIKSTALVREDDRNVFGLCLQRLEDVLIYDAADPKIVPHVPAWLKPSNAASFVLLPIQDNRQPFAILMAAWGEKKTVGFTVAQIRQVRSMLKLAGTARKLSGTS